MVKKENGGCRMLRIRYSKAFSTFPLGHFFRRKIDLTLAKKIN